jgi:protein gp37
MATKSTIQWTDATWNIARGCTKVDEDCKFCYMYRESLNGTRYEPKQVTRTKTVFNLPDRIKEPSKIFASSLTDWAHKDIDTFRDEFWAIIKRNQRHTFQCLTKRTERLPEILPPDWGRGWNNVWLGTSVGSNASRNRIAELLKVHAKLRFLSLEPLHGSVELSDFLYTDCYCSIYPYVNGFLSRLNPLTNADCTIHDLSGKVGIDWVIVGGESGNENGQYRYRECKLEWIESIIEQCKKSQVPVFVKQLGTYLAKELKLSDRHGGNIEEWPEHLRVREFPKEVNHG